MPQPPARAAVDARGLEIPAGANRTSGTGSRAPEALPKATPGPATLDKRNSLPSAEVKKGPAAGSAVPVASEKQSSAQPRPNPITKAVELAQGINHEGQAFTWNYSDRNSPPRIKGPEVRASATQAGQQAGTSPLATENFGSRHPEESKTIPPPLITFYQTPDPVRAPWNYIPGQDSLGMQATRNGPPAATSQTVRSNNRDLVCTCKQRRQNSGLMLSKHANDDDFIFNEGRFTDPCPVHNNDHIYGQGNSKYYS